MELIKFEDIKEEEIQIILGAVFDKLGYKVENYHLSDRANEKGADLILKKDLESVAIAVKKKPVGKDRPQIIDLNKREETKKIYVHLETPSQQFLNFCKDYPNIDFWNLKKVNDFIYQNNPFFFANLLFSEQETIKVLEIMKYFFFQLWRECGKKNKQKVEELDKTSVADLWRLKDLAVMINKIPYHLKPLVQEPIKNKSDELNQHFLNLFIDFLNSLLIPITKFQYFFYKFYSKNKNLVNNSILEMYNRSHWHILGSFQATPDFDAILKELLDPKKDEWKKMLKEKKNKDISEMIKKSESNNDIWASIHTWLESLHNFGYFLEEMVDDILSEYLRDYTIRYDSTREFIA